MYIDDVNIPVTKTAVETIALKQCVMAYPNPAKDNISFITLDKKEKIVTIYNTAGQYVTSLTMQGNYQYDCSKLSSGLYTYMIQDKNSADIQKGMFVIEK